MYKQAAIVGIFALSFATSAYAETFATVNPGGNAVSGTQNYGGSLGDFFTVGSSDLQVTQLGVFDSNQDGIQNNPAGGSTTLTAYLYLYNSVNNTGSLVAAPLTFTSGDGGTHDSVTGYRFKTISPVTLLANQQYAVVADGYNDFEKNGNNNTGGPAPTFSGVGLTYFNNLYGGAGAFPGNDDAGAYAAGNFVYAVVPEPSALGLLMLGGLALRGRSRAART